MSTEHNLLRLRDLLTLLANDQFREMTNGEHDTYGGAGPDARIFEQGDMHAIFDPTEAGNGFQVFDYGPRWENEPNQCAAWQVEFTGEFTRIM